MKPTKVIPPTPGWNDGPRPPREERPPAWDDMSAIERAFFVHRWRKERGFAPNTGDLLADAGFTQEVYEPGDG
jgi:hypothetical protein